MRELNSDLAKISKRIVSALDSLRDAVQRQIDAITKNTEAQQKPGEPHPPGHLERVRAEVDFRPEIANRYYSDQDKSYGLQKRIFWVGLLTLLALGVYTFYTIKMYSANRKAADAATTAANTAADALARSIEQFRIDERAWIEIEPPTPVLKAPASATYGGALFTYDFYLKNVGKSAAFDIAVRAPRGAIDSGLALGDDSAQINRLQETLSKDFFGTKLTPNDEVILLSERNSKTLGPGVRAFSAFQLYGQEPRFDARAAHILRRRFGEWLLVN